ncbi:MAG TPA: hypothetical protein VF265_01850, partial [Nevskiaceae bacterium]
PRNELTRLLDTLTRLARVDRHIDLHEYCLLRALAVQIRDLLTPSASAPAGTLSLRSCRAAFATACAIVARCGSPDNEPAAASAFRRAVQQAIPGWCPEYHASPDWQPVLDRALARLAKLHPADKRKAVLGLAVTITSDGVVTVGEAELLRVICAYLQCPPPTLRGLPRAAA